MASSAISALLLVSYCEAYYNKSSAVVKMGDRLATIDGPKSGEGLLCLFLWVSWVLI